ncbi:MAG: SPOR domain-containing protein [Crocinitomicaceae bacterium]|nr:SPOR domain-containing protein [Crocinitomicaceae bacterium]
MDKYLLEILKDVNTIIIPGLGALTITNHDTGEIMFMSYLKHDDSKLSSYIAEKEDWEENDAKNFIAKYVREIITKLDQGDSYDMFQFGSFVKDGDDIDFVNWKDSEEDEGAPIVAPIVEEPKTEEAPIEVPVEEIPIEIEPEIEEEPVVEEIVPAASEQEEIPPEETKEDQKEKIEEPSVEPEVIAPVVEEKELNIPEKEERAAVEGKLERLKKNKEQKPQRKKRGAGFWMLMIFLVLIIAGGTYVGLNFDSLKQHIPFLADTEEPQEDESKLEDMKDILEGNIDGSVSEEVEEEILEEETTNDLEEVIPEELPEEVMEEEPIIETVIEPTRSSSDLPFHVIAGAFSSEANANRFGDKLRSQGYSVKVGTGRGMNLVSVQSFATRAEANAALTNLKEVAPNGWVYEWK